MHSAQTWVFRMASECKYIPYAVGFDKSQKSVFRVSSLGMAPMRTDPTIVPFLIGLGTRRGSYLDKEDDAPRLGYGPDKTKAFCSL